MRKLFFIIFIIFFVNLFLQSEILILTKKVAKIGNEVIMQDDVEKYVELNKLKYDEAKKILIEKAILYTGAKMYVEEPTKEEIDIEIENDKKDYANRIARPYNLVSNKEFLENLHYNNISWETYRSIVKKELWIKKFLFSVYKNQQLKPYYPSDEEINKFIKNNPAYFEEGGGAYLSMIYLSFYDEEGKYKKSEEIEILRKRAEECLKNLNDGIDFEEMVNKYSTDLISKNNKPRGKLGLVLFDDLRLIGNFTTDIIDELKKSKAGLVKKIFMSRNGFYIFKIDEIINADKYPEKVAKVKARYYLESKYKKSQEDTIRANLIEELKGKMDVVIY